MKFRLKHKKEETASSAAPRWVKVAAPNAWRPAVPGATMEGEYGGQFEKSGQNGRYPAHIVNTETGSFFISGVSIDSLFEAGQVNSGDRVRVVFNGWKTLSNGYKMKSFDVFVAR
jgi:hypothetical protein